MLKKFLFYFALTGWTLALTIHLLSITGIDVSDKAPYIWLLHVGIFIVWLPVVLDLRKNEELIELKESGTMNKMNPIAFYKIVFKHTPTWISVIAIAGFFYAFINFAFFMIGNIGTPDIIDGKFVLHNHGHIIKNLTEQQYHHYKALELRGFSGHWIAFYGIATAVLYKFSGFSENVNTTANNTLA